MKIRTRQCWKKACEGPMHLVIDVHRAQKTDKIQSLLRDECETEITYVPGEDFAEIFHLMKSNLQEDALVQSNQ